MSAAERALIPEPEAAPPPLSQHYSTPAYIGTHRDIGGVRWRKVSPARGVTCDECAWHQHEVRGAWRPRRRPIQQRTYRDTVLLLCAVHAQQWRDRDTATADRKGAVA